MFTGMIDAATLQKFTSNIDIACKGVHLGLQRVHIAFHSNGGGIGEGIALHNLFRALPFELILYNVGTISSIAVVAFLGAKRRIVSARGAFMIHKTQTTVQGATTPTIKSLTDSAVLADERTESILREYIRMPEGRWAHYDHNDLWFSADEAVEFGIAEEVAEFTPPSGTQLFGI